MVHGRGPHPRPSPRGRGGKEGGGRMDLRFWIYDFGKGSMMDEETVRRMVREEIRGALEEGIKAGASRLGT